MIGARLRTKGGEEVSQENSILLRLLGISLLTSTCVVVDGYHGQLDDLLNLTRCILLGGVGCLIAIRDRIRASRRSSRKMRLKASAGVYVELKH